jgi:hypothetical protein
MRKLYLGRLGTMSLVKVKYVDHCLIQPLSVRWCYRTLFSSTTPQLFISCGLKLTP